MPMKSRDFISAEYVGAAAATESEEEAAVREMVRAEGGPGRNAVEGEDDEGAGRRKRGERCELEAGEDGEEGVIRAEGKKGTSHGKIQLKREMKRNGHASK